MSVRGLCRCGLSWTGYDTCHCSGCHFTFTNVRNFDRHQKEGRCLIPTRMRPPLTEVRPGVFGRSDSPAGITKGHH